jgi:hypothetical protein
MLQLRGWACAGLFSLTALTGCSAASGEDSSESSADLSAAACPTDMRQMMDAPMRDPADAAQRFHCLRTTLTVEHDGRAPFISLYSDITDAVSAAIKAGRFEDGAWTAQYLTNFAELYRVAYVGYVDGHGDEIPGAWRKSFDAAKNDALIVQDVTLGVNAHVNRDLSHALVMVGIGSGDMRASHQRDHFTVNDILHENVNKALTELATIYAPGLGEAPDVVMNLLSETYYRAVEAGRLKAWLDAVALTDTPSFLRGPIELEIEDSSKLIADAILLPTFSPEILAKLHELEKSQ